MMNQKHGLRSGIISTGGWFALSRSIQLIAALWVTRQLVPDDFAVMAVVFAIQGFTQNISSLNMSSHLVRANLIDDKDVNVAWSYEFIRNILIYCLIFVMAPIFAGWMDRGDAIDPLRWSAIGLVINSLRNPRLVELRREGLFSMLARIDSIAPICYAALAILFVYFHESYWSLIYAGLGSSIISVVGSYLCRPWHPKFSFDIIRAKPMFSFGVTLLFVSWFSAIREHGVVFLIAAEGLIDDMGYYNRSIAFSISLSLQGVVLLWKVFYPYFSRMEIDGGDSKMYAKRMGLKIILIGLPVTTLMTIIGYRIIPIMLGSAWSSIYHLWVVYMFAGLLVLANAPHEASLQARHNERVIVVCGIISALIQLMLSWILIKKHGVVGASYGCLISVIVVYLIYHFIATKLDVVQRSI